MAALSQAAQTALRLGRVSECLAALTQQRKVAGDDQAAQVWALTTSAGAGRLRPVRPGPRGPGPGQAGLLAHAPLLAEPFWRFAEIVCNWLGGNWAAALADATSMDTNQVSLITAALSGIVAALRMELLRGLGVRRMRRLPHDRRPPAAELSAWARAGLDVDAGRPGDASAASPRSATSVSAACTGWRCPSCCTGWRRPRSACGEREVTAFAAAALAELDQAAP